MVVSLIITLWISGRLTPLIVDTLNNLFPAYSYISGSRPVRIVIWTVCYLIFIRIIHSLVGLIKRVIVKSEDSTVGYHFYLLIISLNPFYRFQIFKQIVGNYYLRYTFKNFKNKLETANDLNYILPFNNVWYVSKGGQTKATSHSWNILNQRYACDFVITDSHGSTHKKDQSDIESYYAFNQIIFSPENGEVVKAKDNIGDNLNTGKSFLNWRISDIRGNYVIIKHGRNNYSLIAHLKRGSITVKKGDYVTKGDKIGLCGNSGRSFRPHVHYQIQSGKSFYFSFGIPLRFNNIDYYKNGSEIYSDSDKNIEKGDWVGNEQLIGHDPQRDGIP